MPASAVDIHPEARAEAGAAIDWYVLRRLSAERADILAFVAQQLGLQLRSGQ